MLEPFIFQYTQTSNDHIQYNTNSDTYSSNFLDNKAALWNKRYAHSDMQRVKKKFRSGEKSIIWFPAIPPLNRKSKMQYFQQKYYITKIKIIAIAGGD